MAFNLIGSDEPLVIREGADISIDIALEDENGALDLTGYSATMRFGPDHDTTAELTLTVGSGLTINESEGHYHLCPYQCSNSSVYLQQWPLRSGDCRWQRQN